MSEMSKRYTPKVFNPRFSMFILNSMLIIVLGFSFELLFELDNINIAGLIAFVTVIIGISLYFVATNVTFKKYYSVPLKLDRGQKRKKQRKVVVSILSIAVITHFILLTINLTANDFLLTSLILSSGIMIALSYISVMSLDLKILDLERMKETPDIELKYLVIRDDIDSFTNRMPQLKRPYAGENRSIHYSQLIEKRRLILALLCLIVYLCYLIVTYYIITFFPSSINLNPQPMDPNAGL